MRILAVLVTMDWPARSSTCSCEVFGCDDQGTSCSCSLHGFSGSYVDKCNSGTYCCASTTSPSCRCGSSPCFGSEKPVDACTAAAIGCGSTQKLVSGCSL